MTHEKKNVLDLVDRIVRLTRKKIAREELECLERENEDGRRLRILFQGVYPNQFIHREEAPFFTGVLHLFKDRKPFFDEVVRVLQPLQSLTPEDVAATQEDVVALRPPREFANEFMTGNADWNTRNRVMSKILPAISNTTSEIATRILSQCVPEGFDEVQFYKETPCFRGLHPSHPSKNQRERERLTQMLTEVFSQHHGDPSVLLNPSLDDTPRTDPRAFADAAVDPHFDALHSWDRKEEGGKKSRSYRSSKKSKRKSRSRSRKSKSKSNKRKKQRI